MYINCNICDGNYYGMFQVGVLCIVIGFMDMIQKFNLQVMKGLKIFCMDFYRFFILWVVFYDVVVIGYS